MLAHELRNPLAAIVTSACPCSNAAPQRMRSRKAARDLIRRQTTHLRRLVDDLLDAARVTQRQDRSALGSAGSQRACAPDCRRTSSKRSFNRATRHFASRCPLRSSPCVAIRCGWSRCSPTCSTTRRSTATRGMSSSSASRWAAQRPASPRRASSCAITASAWMGARCRRSSICFSQADVPLARSRGGLGIGLTLVRTLAELHAGKVTARSEGLGKGSEFELILPLLVDPLSMRQGSCPPRMSRSGRRTPDPASATRAHHRRQSGCAGRLAVPSGDLGARSSCRR